MGKVGVDVMREYIDWAQKRAPVGTTDIHRVLVNVGAMLLVVAAQIDEHSETIDALKKRVDALES